MRRGFPLCATVVAALAALALPGAAAAQHEMPPPGPGFLEGPGEWGKIEFVSKAVVTDTEDLVADVGLDPSLDYAYLANWGEPDCAANAETGGINSPDAGIWVIDISDIENPEEVGFIPSSQDSRPGEGVHAVEISTKFFTGTSSRSTTSVRQELQGRLLAVGRHQPAQAEEAVRALRRPTSRREGHAAGREQIHSVFIWTRATERSSCDGQIEKTDVDIFEITNPKRPRLIEELDLNDFGVDPARARTDRFVPARHGRQEHRRRLDHAAVVLGRRLGELNVTTRRSRSSSPTATTRRSILSSSSRPGSRSRRRATAIRREFTIDNEFIIGTDEDFDPFRLAVTDAGRRHSAGAGVRRRRRRRRRRSPAPRCSSARRARATRSRARRPPTARSRSSSAAVLLRGEDPDGPRRGRLRRDIIMNREGADAVQRGTLDAVVHDGHDPGRVHRARVGLRPVRPARLRHRRLPRG